MQAKSFLNCYVFINKGQPDQPEGATVEFSNFTNLILSDSNKTRDDLVQPNWRGKLAVGIGSGDCPVGERYSVTLRKCVSKSSGGTVVG